MSSRERLRVENSTKFNKNDLKDASANNVNIKHTTSTTLIAYDRKAITDSSNCICKHRPLITMALVAREATKQKPRAERVREKKKNNTQARRNVYMAIRRADINLADIRIDTLHGFAL